MRPDEQPGQNPYAFVVGCPRSGTTMLQRMLDNHPMLAMANDTHFVPLAVSDVPLGVDPPLTPELVEWVRTYRRFHRLGLSDEAVERAAAATSYAGFVGALFTEYGAERGKRLVGEKTPDYVKWLPRLHALFPWVRSIHLTRDGRDVALSTLEWAKDGKGPSKLRLWDEAPVAVCALWWRWQVTTGRRDGAELGPRRYREVSYEDLAAHPEEHLAEIAEFLGLPDAPEMAAYHVGRTSHRPGLSSKEAWLPPTSGLRDWRADMSERDRGLFELLAGDLLSELGYERSVHTFSPELAEAAERYRQWWEQDRAKRRR
ncbi:MAG: sulfotransferase family protein [Nocardioidaceae bacterium]